MVQIVVIYDKIIYIVGGIEHGQRFIYWNHRCCTFNNNSIPYLNMHRNPVDYKEIT